MRLLQNRGTNRVVDELRSDLQEGAVLDWISRGFSLPAFSQMNELLENVSECRLVLPDVPPLELGIYGEDADRAARNALTLRSLARRCAAWLEYVGDYRSVTRMPPQSAIVVRRNGSPRAVKSISGDCPLTTEGLGLAPSHHMSLIPCSDTPEEANLIGSWFSELWDTLPPPA